MLMPTRRAAARRVRAFDYDAARLMPLPHYAPYATLMIKRVVTYCY